MYKRIKKVFLNYIPILIKTEVLHKIPHLYPLLKINPSSATLMITNRCNLKCIMCKQWKELVIEELQTDDWKKIIQDLKKNGIKNIHFTGGEPLLRKDFEELVSFSFKQGFVVGFTTNGILLNKELLERLVNAGLRSIAVSIDAIGIEYDKIRGVPNSFERLRKAVFDIAEIRKKRKIDAYINFTLMKSNMNELKNVKKFTDKIELPLAICLLDRNSYIFDLEDNKKKFWISEKEDFKNLEKALFFLKEEKINNPPSLITNFPAIDFIMDYFKDPHQVHIPCVSSQDRVIIDPYGNLLGGCMSMGTFGNIKDKPFGELRKQLKYKNAKKDMFYKKCKGCSCGYLFNIRCLPGLVIKNLFERTKHIFAKNV